jgi:hypothetical protein
MTTAPAPTPPAGEDIMEAFFLATIDRHTRRPDAD